MILRAFLFAFALLAAQPVAAGDLRVTIVDANGRPVRDAVATLHVAAQPAGVIRFAWPMQVTQRAMQFDPFVLIAPSGAVVSFPNLDDVRHQVFSFSEAGPFELRLYGRDQTRSVQFRNVGVIAVGCNIHDNMSAFIYVVDTPFAVKTGADGVAMLRNTPAGQATLRVWHPYMRAAESRVERTLTLSSGDHVERVQVRLRAPPDRDHGY